MTSTQPRGEAGTDGTGADEAWTAPGTGRDRAVAGMLMVLGQHQRVSEQNAALGTADLRLLWMFADRRPRTLREISETLRLEQSTVNRQVHVALAEGILRRYREPGRAAWLIEPTDDGLRTFETDIVSALGAFEQGLAALGDDGAGQFLELLEGFVTAYGAAVQERRPGTASSADA
ncbi:MarR family winged helix-turn-helix transcriptional regulator [Cellulomonas sp. PhB143]|uniref:MarR family winged helix-turn-helix transcriptional regulator n=1 Tax=Cellulomonas sp. PhB143 TaxID=2485186 RepID=UPI000F938F2F|nr:MarR family winged helix-turn-helix transcriptional regulator [Cellulomonas sp. PhB143]ROS75447.1 DNA-binding MarR family transcriptional regulator [Cellulomonas sp. PhB143]